MALFDYLDSDVFLPLYSNDVPLLNCERITRICEELSYAIKNEERIFIYGDYDMDGLCSMLVWKEVLEFIRAPSPAVFRYTSRTHALDSNILEQTENSGCRIVLICDTGSSAQDSRVLAMLKMAGQTPIVIDHHVSAMNYLQLASDSLVFNSCEERELLGGQEVSGAYASLLVAKVLCEKYLDTSLPYNAKVFALASMYADSVDMSSSIARALYNSVALVKAPGPELFQALNTYHYLYGRRFFSFIVAPKINGCFRMGNLAELNNILTATNKYQMSNVSKRLIEAHGQASRLSANFVSEFKRTRLGGIVLCVHEVNEYTLLRNIRNFTGIVATKIANEEHAACVVLVHSNGVYKGSVRDYYGRELLDTFKLFCKAGGHPSAFGIEVSQLTDFVRHLSSLSKILEEKFDKSYLTLHSSILEGEEDFNSLALYNEYMNVKPKAILLHRCTVATLIKSTKFRKYYDVGFGRQHLLTTDREITSGSLIMIEPAICRGVELREME